MTKSSSLALLVLCLWAITFITPTFSAHRNPWFSELTKPHPLCDYNASAHLNIHISAHTHNDIGWLKTIDQYYYGDKRDIDMRGGVQYILDNVVSELYRDPKKRFIYVEMGFFKRWWNQQDPDTQDILKQLIAKGQFEFINGGYCMNDEAAVYYEDSIDQMTLGHQFLQQNFNYIPEIGWHIDPFGHANAQASMFAQMGFKAFFFGRIDYQDKQRRLDTGNMETLWIPATSQGLESAILAVVTYNTYFDVGNFDFSLYSSNKPIGFDPTLEDYDLPQRADDFIAWFRQMEPSYKSGELFQTLGEDFAFQDGHMDFKNYDQLFKYLSANSKKYNVDVSYSTPGRFISALYPMNLKFEEKADDFFPYADGPNAYWTGYFSSRVSIKGAVRKLGRFTQSMKKLATQALLHGSSAYVKNNFPAIDSALLSLEEAMANGQHHDAVTGTERQIVAEDYKLYFAKGENAVKQTFLYPYLQEKVSNDLGLKNLQFSTCELNTSAVFCGTTYNNLKTNKPVLLVINNPAQGRNSTVRVKVPNANVQATDVNGTNINTDVICSNKTDTSDCDLFFGASFEGYTISYFYLKPSSTSNQVTAQQITYGKDYPISATQSIGIDSTLQQFMLKYCKDSEGKDCYSTSLYLSYNYYKGYQSNNDQNSGAYIFRPTNDTNAGSITYTTPVSGAIYLGKNLVQIHVEQKLIINDIRIYNDLANGIEVSSFVDSINVADNQGKEIVLRVSTPNIRNTGNTFYTDSMGLEMQKRVFNSRPTWNLSVSQPASGNYYPVQSAIYIQDQTTQERLAVIPDRAQGGASLQTGSIELMIHRRLIADDARGVGEALNEKDWDGQGLRQWVTHTILFSKPGYIDTHYRQIQYHNDQPNTVILAQYASSDLTPKVPEAIEKSMYEGLDLDYIKILARPLGTLRFLYRFQNLDETQTRSVSTSVFQGPALKLAKVTEMSLSANQAKADMVKKKFNWNGRLLNNASFINTDYLTSDSFSLRPLEIRTFIGEYNYNAKLIDM